MEDPQLTRAAIVVIVIGAEATAATEQHWRAGRHTRAAARCPRERRGWGGCTSAAPTKAVSKDTVAAAAIVNARRHRSRRVGAAGVERFVDRFRPRNDAEDVIFVNSQHGALVACDGDAVSARVGRRGAASSSVSAPKGRGGRGASTIAANVGAIVGRKLLLQENAIDVDGKHRNGVNEVSNVRASAHGLVAEGKHAELAAPQQLHRSRVVGAFGALKDEHNWHRYGRGVGVGRRSIVVIVMMIAAPSSARPVLAVRRR